MDGLQIATNFAFEGHSKDNHDGAESHLDDDDDDEDDEDEYDDDDLEENVSNNDNDDNESEFFPMDSRAFVTQELHSGSSNHGDMFPFGGTVPRVSSGFFSTISTSANDAVWDLPMPMNGQLSYGSGLIESESSSSIQPTPPSRGELAALPDRAMLDSRGEFDDLLDSEPNPSWAGISDELGHVSPSSLPSQTTLVLENVHPETLKSLMYILIETNTKMTMQRHQ
ncbi:hypothetical protein BP6252_11341 [Coleophoma cylindrospora]|uniref:Uncharacterized protein n=1 Tax=Coleophoma cylindrospora TaxID=1849047 RepID=A0A3D8QPP7_9HELO|nr:hypothetical protein BP6252_11341 [Coleophoma cylindrospora]